LRFTIFLSLNLEIEEIKKAIMEDERTLVFLNGLEPKRWIIIPNKIINIVF